LKLTKASFSNEIILPEATFGVKNSFKHHLSGDRKLAVQI